jgi:hypothetical protein
MPNSDSNVVREGVFHKAFAVAGKALGQCFISLSRRRRGGRAVLFQHNILNTHKSKHIKQYIVLQSGIYASRHTPQKASQGS